MEYTVPSYMAIYSEYTDWIKGEIDFNKAVKECYEKSAYLISIYDKKQEVQDYIWSIFTSSRYSVYASHMRESIVEKNKMYIDECVRFCQPIHIVLAGFPGKCANEEKVYSRMPDIGELEILLNLKQLDNLIRYRHSAGLQITFMSDYYALEKTFFPNRSFVESYIEQIRKWKDVLGLDLDIIPITKIYKSYEEFDMTFTRHYLKDWKSQIEKGKSESRLQKSIKDNMNIKKAREYFEKIIQIKVSDQDICYLAEKYYEEFWRAFSESGSVSNYFNRVLYASPVAYHPDRRLCMRLQSRHARLAAWNGVGIIKNAKVYSVDQRTCNKEKYKPIYDDTGYFWGYIYYL